jgi:hypothetical protein
MNKLLPPNFNELVTDAVKQFWTGRISTTITSQAGGRGSVIAGKNLNAFANLILAVGKHSGFKDQEIIVASKGKQVIPGYFRATKEWDALVVYKGRLIAAFELKSQVGSFGNNINNRSEEVLGSATDFWTAHREKGFDVPFIQRAEPTLFETIDTKPPFLGFLMLLEDCAASSGRDVKVKQPHFAVRPEFLKASYARRYEILLERMVAEQLYSSTCLLLSDRKKGAKKGDHSFPKDTLSPRSFFADFAGKLLAAKETY